jgi:chlorophyll(ide) b reductase
LDWFDLLFWKGLRLAVRQAIRVMRNQTAGGHIFNMDGAGADGSPTPRFAAYGATKRGLVQLGKSLQAELKMLGINNVGIHNLSPGMVTTELLMAGETSPPQVQSLQQPTVINNQ